MRSIKHTAISLNLPHNVALLIVLGRHIAASMTNNSWFPNPTLPLATVSAHIDELAAAELSARDRTKGSAAVRNVKKKVVEDDLFALAAYVRVIAAHYLDLVSPEEAEVVTAIEVLDMSFDAAAEMLGRSRGTVSTQYDRALRKLRALAAAER